jgi:hypothetical protein
MDALFLSGQLHARLLLDALERADGKVLLWMRDSDDAGAAEALEVLMRALRSNVYPAGGRARSRITSAEVTAYYDNR